MNNNFIKTNHEKSKTQTSRYMYDLSNPNNTHTYPKRKRV